VTQTRIRCWLRRGAILSSAVLAGGWSAVGASPPSSLQLRVLRLVDHSRRAQFRNGTSGPRALVTYVRVPTGGHAPFPLIVFAHGFAVTPHIYARLLDTWTRAGYVVAAPVFPVENANAPGGPDQSDLVNEPGDIRFVISRLVGSTSPLGGLVDPKKIAVAGQSDGAVAALSVAYDQRVVDRRIDAAMIMSGAAPAGFTSPPRGSPPLLAIQGASDPINPPSATTYYFGLMRQPKFLLWLLGATHLPPYTTTDRWAAVVDRATTAFLDHYLRGAPLHPLVEAGTQTGVARITSKP
jgi:predicted dienelactone hydrolase